MTTDEYKIEYITEKEWGEYDWIRVGKSTFIKGIRHTSPPNDGYHYVEVTELGDEEQKWKRAQKI